jgi:ABC-2 type transport system ATP-binding protein
MSTHTLAIAEEIADRIGILDHGRLHFLGTKSELQRELASHETSLESLFLKKTEGNNGQDRSGENETGTRPSGNHRGAALPQAAVPLPPT